MIVKGSNLKIGYPTKVILTVPSFTIEPGQVVQISGHNGSGKTTLSRTIAGLLPIFEGEFINSFRKIGWVPQESTINAQLPMRIGDFLKIMTNKINKEHIYRLGLSDSLNTRWKDASGGKKQRAILARVLSEKPDLIILDEPFANLDQSGINLIIDLILEWKNRRIGILLIDHHNYFRQVDFSYSIVKNSLVMESRN